MKLGKATIGAVVLAAAAAPQALAVQGAPLRNPNGVVIAWDKRAHANVVVTRDSRVYVIHSLRRYRPGTRVRIRGIKWGRMGLGIKWGFHPRGIKWGIRIARNGTYIAAMRPMGRVKVMSLRGTVIRRYRRGIAISVRGSVLTFPYARGAVWLPRTTLNAGVVGDVGSRAQFKLTLTSQGAPVVSTAKELVPATPGATIPYAGTVVSVDPTSGTVVVDASTNPAFPLLLTLTVPVNVDLTKYKHGDHIAGAVVTSRTGGDELVTTHISQNGSFAAADNPATTVEAPAPDPVSVSIAANLATQWDAGKAADKFTAAGMGLYTSQHEQLALLERQVLRSDTPRALDTITRFIIKVQKANEPASAPVAIDPAFQSEILMAAHALQAHLAQAISPAGWPSPGTGGTGTDPNGGTAGGGTTGPTGGGTTGGGTTTGGGNGNSGGNGGSGNAQGGGGSKTDGSGTGTTAQGQSTGPNGNGNGSGKTDGSTESSDATPETDLSPEAAAACMALTNPGAAKRSPVATAQLIAHCAGIELTPSA